MKKSIQDSEHYWWGKNCEGWRLVQNGNLSVIQELMPPNTEEIMHYHNFSQQFFYILRGGALFDLDGKTFHINQGEGIHIKPGVQHRIRNTSDKSLSFLVISQPSIQSDRTEEPFTKSI